MKCVLFFCLLFACPCCFSQELDIIPKPVEVSMGKGDFVIDKNTVIVFDNHTKHLMDYLTNYISRHYGISLTSSMSIPENIAGIHLIFDDTEKSGYYSLESTKEKINIRGSLDGLFYGIQTLIQLLPPQHSIPVTERLKIAQLTINDHPRFAYRGMHLDCGRHFFQVDFIKKYIDYLALHKFNKFHWHLTEDQGWRIEIKKHPKLTQIGSWRNGTVIGRYPGTGNDGIKYGGYYTQSEIKEIVKYAADRYIDIIPEIELPGHSSAAIAAYPELSCFPHESSINYFPEASVWYGDSSGKQVQQTWGVFDDVFCAGQENTFNFLLDVLDEVLSLFPSKYIHVGGDECPKENWKRCNHCQQRIKENNLKDEHELQSYFIQRIEKYLNSRGRILIGWDEILEGGLAPKAVVMSWRGEDGGIAAAKQNHDVIMTPGNPVYFDHTQSENDDSITIGGYNPIEKVYAYEPLPNVLTTAQAKYILGAQANVWTEYMKNTRKVEYMIFPRMAALSEVLWSTKEFKDWKDFEKRLQTQFKRYDLWKVNYSEAYFELKGTVLPTDNYNGILWQVESKTKESIHINVNRGDTIWSYINPQQISKSCTYYANNNKAGISQKFSFNKATGKKITIDKPASNSYPGNGPFTLVNGVQNEKGLSHSKEFLGFEGDDCVATIDLGQSQIVSDINVHYYHQPGSWIYRPAYIAISVSADGIHYSPIEITKSVIDKNVVANIFTNPVDTRFIKIHIANFGTIPPGNPGAGHNAWLFIDEIEIN